MEQFTVDILVAVLGERNDVEFRDGFALVHDYRGMIPKGLDHPLVGIVHRVFVGERVVLDLVLGLDLLVFGDRLLVPDEVEQSPAARNKEKKWNTYDQATHGDPP